MLPSKLRWQRRFFPCFNALIEFSCGFGWRVFSMNGTVTADRPRLNFQGARTTYHQSCSWQMAAVYDGPRLVMAGALGARIGAGDIPAVLLCP